MDELRYIKTVIVRNIRGFWEHKNLIFAFLAATVTIPVIFFLVSLRSDMSEQKQVTLNIPHNIPTNPVDEIKKNTEVKPAQLADVAGTSTEVFFGPSMSFKINLEGRPQNNQSSKVFVGIAVGTPSNNPQFLLSYLVNIPVDGSYSKLSLAGLSQGSTYTAYFKGPAQLATSSAFTVRPIDNDLGLQSMKSGDLNEDNLINEQDYLIIKSSAGSNPTSERWNPNFDINLDGVINNLDIAFVIKNLNMVGASGPWYSKLGIGSATQSAILNTPANIGGPQEASKASQPGYWMWVPTSP